MSARHYQVYITYTKWQQLCTVYETKVLPKCCISCKVWLDWKKEMMHLGLPMWCYELDCKKPVREINTVNKRVVS